jgi:anti-sigma factor RsiW
MNCQESRELIHAYSDGELDLVRSVEVEKHVGHCENCAQDYNNLRTLRSAIGSSEMYFKSPPGLRNRVRSAIRAEEKSADAPGPLISWVWLKWGFSLAGTALTACVVTAVLLTASADDRLADEIAAGHARSLMADHLFDVPSADPHTVKPWIDRKLDFAPPVVDLKEHGFPLVGGRLDYQVSRPVAALVYQRQQHVINLFIWPAANTAAVEEKTFIRRGYNLIHWTAAGMTFWAVSDLNRNELHDFEQLIKGQAAPVVTH